MSANKSGISVVSANKNSTSETNSTIAFSESKARFVRTNPKKGKWKKGEKGNVYLSPFDVCLDRDEKTVVQPDLCIVSQMGNLNENGLKGIPDFIAEIISNSTAKKDYTLKLKKYWNAGVKEYWIIDPLKERIVTYLFQEEDMDMRIYRWKDQVPMGIYNDLIVDFGGF